MNPEHQAMVRDAWSAGQELTRRAETTFDLAVLAAVAVAVVAAALFVIAFTARSTR